MFAGETEEITSGRGDDAVAARVWVVSTNEVMVMGGRELDVVLSALELVSELSELELFELELSVLELTSRLDDDTEIVEFVNMDEEEEETVVEEIVAGSVDELVEDELVLLCEGEAVVDLTVDSVLDSVLDSELESAVELAEEEEDSVELLLELEEAEEPEDEELDEDVDPVEEEEEEAEVPDPLTVTPNSLQEALKESIALLLSSGQALARQEMMLAEMFLQIHGTWLRDLHWSCVFVSFATHANRQAGGVALT